LHSPLSKICDRTDFAAVAGGTTVFYTPAVVNAPGRIAQDIQSKRQQLRALAVEVLWREQEAQEKAKHQEEALRRPIKSEVPARHNGYVVQSSGSAATRSADSANASAQNREGRIPDPTDLIIIDEAGRLK